MTRYLRAKDSFEPVSVTELRQRASDGLVTVFDVGPPEWKPAGLPVERSEVDARHSKPSGRLLASSRRISVSDHSARIPFIRSVCWRCWAPCVKRRAILTPVEG
jgi:hypothetical protein